MPTERELAATVVAWLRAEGWTVYQEVTTRRGEPIADIVAVEATGRFLWIVECKTAFSMQVIAQADEWRRYGYCHWVSVAVPPPRPRSKDSGRRFAETVCRERGIGIISVGTTCEERVGARFNRQCRNAINRIHFTDRLRSKLTPEMQDYCAAGSPDGGHLTTFRSTVDRLVALVAKDPGIALRDALTKVDHHWATDSTAASCIRRYIGSGVIPSLRIERGRLYPRAAPEETPRAD